MLIDVINISGIVLIWVNEVVVDVDFIGMFNEFCGIVVCEVVKFV